MMTLSKRLLVTLGAVPLLLGAAATPPQPKAKNPCESGCPVWGAEELESFFGTPFPRVSTMQSVSTLKETDKAYLISIDLPGMDKKDISIETAGNRLMVSGERRDEREGKESTKRSYRQFNQSFSLPDDANLEAITATSTNGVLKITIPKTGKKKTRKIEIK